MDYQQQLEPVMKLVILVLCSLIGVSASAQNSIYRCKDSTGKTLFSDKACPAGAGTTEVAAPLPEEVRTRAPAHNPYIDMATDEIKSALRSGDTAKAQRLATTSEQLRMVTEAIRSDTRIKQEAASARRSDVIICRNSGSTTICR